MSDNKFEIRDNILIKYLGDSNKKIISITKESIDNTFTEKSRNIIIPDLIEKIGENAFRFTISSISLPESLKEIEDGAFSFCSLLKKIVIPRNVHEINASIIAESDIEEVILCGNNIILKDSAFLDACCLKKINLENVIIIEDRAFEYCTNLKNIKLTDKIQSIGNNVFKSCSNLNVEVPFDKIKLFGIDKFTGIKSITTIIDGKEQTIEYAQIRHLFNNL